MSAGLAGEIIIWRIIIISFSLGLSKTPSKTIVLKRFRRATLLMARYYLISIEIRAIAIRTIYKWINQWI